jgi:predicted P-loop ATPase/GTPase
VTSVPDPTTDAITAMITERDQLRKLVANQDSMITELDKMVKRQDERIENLQRLVDNSNKLIDNSTRLVASLEKENAMLREILAEAGLAMPKAGPVEHNVRVTGTGEDVQLLGCSCGFSTSNEEELTLHIAYERVKNAGGES